MTSPRIEHARQPNFRQRRRKRVLRDKPRLDGVDVADGFGDAGLFNQVLEWGK
ncbi:MAG: hypothetical protein ACE5HT_06850 [Gemmatimonadales bacterium]